MTENKIHQTYVVSYIDKTTTLILYPLPKHTSLKRSIGNGGGGGANKHGEVYIVRYRTSFSFERKQPLARVVIACPLRL